MLPSLKPLNERLYQKQPITRLYAGSAIFSNLPSRTFFLKGLAT